MPVGVFSLASKLLEEGFDVEVVNIPLEAQLAGVRYADVLKELKAEVYAVSLNWFVHADGALETAKLIKLLNPSAKVVVGGMTATVFAEEVARNGYVDAIVLGEGEEALTTYVKYAVKGVQPADRRGLYVREGRKWVRGGMPVPPSLARAKYTDGVLAMRHALEYLKTGILGFMPAQQPHFWFAAARGCLFDRIYCGGSREGYSFATGRASMAVRDPAAVAEEVAQLSEMGLRIARLSARVAFKPAAGHSPEEAARLAAAELEPLGFEVVYSGWAIHVHRFGVNKAAGLLEACRALGIEPERVAAIGDSAVDEPMLEAARFGVALANSPVSLKRKADYVTAESHYLGFLEAVKFLENSGLFLNARKLNKNRAAGFGNGPRLRC